MSSSPVQPWREGDGRFLWGVSTSGFQHEGGYNGHGQPANNWAAWERSGRVEPSGRAAGFWNGFEADFDRTQRLGLNAFRLGIEWARVQPGRAGERSIPSFDRQTLDHYGRILVAARQRGLEPLVTLHHFTHPEWLGADAWLEPRTVALFRRYVRRVVLHVNRCLQEAGLPPLRWFLTVNEPNMLIVNTYQAHSFPGGRGSGFGASLRALQTLLLAHLAAHEEIHDLYRTQPSWPAPWVSFNNYASDLYWMDKVFLDLLSARGRGVERDQIGDWLREQHHEFNSRFDRAGPDLEETPAYWLGMLVKWLHHGIGSARFQSNSLALLLNHLYRHPEARTFDYVAFDYYDPFIGNAFRFPRFDEMFMTGLSVREWMMQSITAKWWDWKVLPQGIRFFTELYAEEHPGLPIVMAENGMAVRQRHNRDRFWREDALTRSDFLRMNIGEVVRLKQEGLPLAGYFHWSLTDNYEWGSYQPRFGLYAVDFDSADLRRQVREEQGTCPAETYAELVRRDRGLGQRGPEGDAEWAAQR